MHLLSLVPLVPRLLSQVEGFDVDQLWEEVRLVNEPVLPALERKLPNLSAAARAELTVRFKARL